MTYFPDTQDDRDRAAHLAEVEELYFRDEWQNERAEDSERYVDYSDVRDPESAQVLVGHGFHVYHYSPGASE